MSASRKVKIKRGFFLKVHPSFVINYNQESQFYVYLFQHRASLGLCIRLLASDESSHSLSAVQHSGTRGNADLCTLRLATSSKAVEQLHACLLKVVHMIRQHSLTFGPSFDQHPGDGGARRQPDRELVALLTALLTTLV